MSNIKPKDILLSLLAIALVVILPHSGLISFPFLYTIPVLLIIWLCLRYFNEAFVDIGLNFRSIHINPVVIGILSGIFFFGCSQLILYPVLEILYDFEEVDVNLYNQLRGNTGFYVAMVLMGWLVGGLYEEIVFHGFIYSRFEKIISGKYTALLCFLLTSILFGLYHLQLGTADAINAFFVGMGYLGLILYFKKNLWYGVFCHGAYNTMAMTFLYLGYL